MYAVCPNVALFIHSNRIEVGKSFETGGREGVESTNEINCWKKRNIYVSIVNTVLIKFCGLYAKTLSF